MMASDRSQQLGLKAEFVHLEIDLILQLQWRCKKMQQILQNLHESMFSVVDETCNQQVISFAAEVLLMVLP